MGFRRRLPQAKATGLFSLTALRASLNKFFRHVRRVKWLVKYSPPGALFRVPANFRNTICYVDQDNRIYSSLIRHNIGRITRLDPEIVANGRMRRKRFVSKYDSGGEGPAHLELKKFVRSHPERLGLHPVVPGQMEYCFESS